MQIYQANIMSNIIVINDILYSLPSRMIESCWRDKDYGFFLHNFQ